MSSTKCPKCGIVNWTSAAECKRCGAVLAVATDKPAGKSRGRSDEEKKQVRRAALRKMKYGAIATVLFVVGLFAVPYLGYQFSLKPGLAITLLPVAWFLAGVLQLVTGTPFEEMSARWDGLAGWQRGLIGISTFVGGLVVVIGTAVVIIFAFF